MAYRIAYRNLGKAHNRNCKKTQIPNRWIVPVCVFLMLAALIIGWQNASVYSYFLPGDPEVTAAAFGELVRDLRSGESFREAVTAFCIEVMENAQAPR